MVQHIESADGTRIAVESHGSGPAVLIVGGAFSTRHAGRELAEPLAADFTVSILDRRGRGDSDAGDGVVEPAREIDDLLAVVAALGGGDPVHLVGHSSGAVLALHAALAAPSGAVGRIVVHEPPFTIDLDVDTPASDALIARIEGALDGGDPDAAVSLFLEEATGQDPAPLRSQPFWSGMLALADSLRYDLRLVGDGRIPTALAGLAAPLLVLAGEGGTPAMQASGRELAGVVPGAEFLLTASGGHQMPPEVFAPIIRDWLLA